MQALHGIAERRIPLEALDLRLGVAFLGFLMAETVGYSLIVDVAHHV